MDVVGYGGVSDFDYTDTMPRSGERASRRVLVRPFEDDRLSRRRRGRPQLSYPSDAIQRGAHMLCTALGTAIARSLEDPAIVEVMLNPDGRLWVDRLSDGLPVPANGFH